MNEPLQSLSSAATTTTIYNDDMDSTHSSACSTPYVSAPTSPGRNESTAYYYYSAPASPMHFLLSSTSQQQVPFSSEKSSSTSSSVFDDFDFSSGPMSSATSGPMSSADELFFNGQIRPMRLSSHLQRPQMLAPLIDGDENDEDLVVDNTCNVRGRDTKLRNKSLRRRTRSMSPLRSTTSLYWPEGVDDDDVIAVENDLCIEDEEKTVEDVKTTETTPSSRSSSVGRTSKRWVLLKEFLYRSKSEGRNNGQKFWGNLSFSPVLKDKKLEKVDKSEEKLKIPKMKSCASSSSVSSKDNNGVASEHVKKKRTNGGMGKRRMTMPSAHEMHYKTNRAQAEEMRKKTFLPYRQGLLGCLGFSSRSYGAWNGFTRALNPVSSR